MPARVVRARWTGWRRAAAAGVVVAAGLVVAIAPSAGSASAPSWLAAVNAYRTSSGLVPVTENAAWSAGIADHLTYMARAPAVYFVGAYRSLHTENPASPFYTAAGADAARSSDLYEGVGSSVAPINGWMAAPFHAIGIPRAQLRQVGFAFHGADANAGLDVIRGLSGPPSPRPILFPGPDAASALTTYAGDESPSPPETCGWNAAGLPLIALLPSAPALGTRATLVARGGVGVPTCVVDQYTYRSSDPVYGPTGLEILRADHVVLMIPERPLTNTRYTATIRQPGRAAVAWSFCGPRCVGRPGAPVISRLVAGAGRLTVAWRPPGDTGGTPIVSYLVWATDNGPTTVCVTRRTVCTLTGLARRRAYLVRVVARSAVASSPASAARRVRTS
jgi:Fibronectin type III domain/Cysteine-rich secretory protein family